MSARACLPLAARLALTGGYLLLGIVFLISLSFGIGAAVDAALPVQWGTFMQSSCESTKSGCRPIGSWTSDDGSRTLDDVALVGSIGPDGTARAGYRGGSTATAGDRVLVRTEDGFSGALWMPWAGCVLALLLAILLTWIYRGKRVDPRALPLGTPLRE